MRPRARGASGSVAVAALRDPDEASVPEGEEAQQLAGSAVIGPGLDADDLRDLEPRGEANGHHLRRGRAEVGLAATVEHLPEGIAGRDQAIAAPVGRVAEAERGSGRRDED